MADMYESGLVQNVQAAGADARGVAEATRVAEATKGAITASRIEEGTTIFKGVVAGDIASTKRDAEKLQADFLRTNQAAKQAQWALGVNSRMREDVLGSLADQDVQGVEPAKMEAAGKLLGDLKEQAERLKSAAMGGMSNEEYAARVTALSKKYVARYPGFADQVRQIVGAASGLEGADLWAQQQFVKERFSKQDKASAMSPEKLLAADISTAAKTLGMFETDLYNIASTNPAEWENIKTRAKGVMGTKIAEETLKAQVGAARVASDAQADNVRAGFGAIFGAALQSNVFSSLNSTTEQKYAQAIKEIQTKGNIADMAALQPLVELHAAEMRTHVQRAKQSAVSTLESFLANNPNVSADKRKELFADIDRQANEVLEMYGDKKGLVAMANVLSNYRGKTMEEQIKLMDLNIKLMGSMQNAPIVQQFMRGGAERERVKRESPELFTILTQLEGNIIGKFNTINSVAEGNASLVRIQEKLADAGKTGKVVEQTGTMTPQETKATHQILFDLAKAATKLEPINAALIESAIITNTEKGANARQIKEQWKRVYDDFKDVPVDTQNKIKESLSNSTITVINKLRRIKQDVEKKHGVVLQFGVNDAGDIALVAPKQEQAGLFESTEGGAAVGRPMIMDKRVAKERLAQKEFYELALPMLTGVVYNRAAIEGTEPRKISNEYAPLLNSTTPYSGFFSLQPRSAATGATGVSLGDVTGKEQPVMAPPKTEKQMIANSAGVDDIRQVIARSKEMLKDVVPGTATHNRIMQDIKWAEEELTRMGAK